MKKIFLIWIIICILLFGTIFVLSKFPNDSNQKFSGIVPKKEYEKYMEQNANNEAVIRVVIVKVYENNKLLVMKNPNSLNYVSYKNNEGLEFKANQEIEIHFDGIIAETYPGQINNVSEIKIVKENSDIVIPDNILRFAYSSKDNVDIKIDSFNTEGIEFTITDINEIPYEYLNNYEIYQETKNPDYTGTGVLTEATSNSTSSFTRFGFRVYIQKYC